jgi:SAM-dependent methyltransferase
MKECSKSIARRLGDPNFTRCYFVGHGVDVGGKPDPLALYQELFCRIESVRTWDLDDGDAQLMNSVADGQFDFLHSSHCLEHLQDPLAGLRTWLRVVRDGGHVVVTIPDEDLYEQGVFPSTYNRDHKWTFTIFKTSSWSSRSVNVVDLVRELGEAAELLRLEQLNSTYRFGLPRYDQTLSPVGESGIEFVLRKRTVRDIADRGRWRRDAGQPALELRKHLNQYIDDLSTLKSNNNIRPPFSNDSEI